jgi:hypothetical protein
MARIDETAAPVAEKSVEILGDHRRELSKTELRLASEVDFDKQEINGSIKCSDRAHQQEQTIGR